MKTTTNTTKKKMPLRRKWFFILFILVLLCFVVYKGNTTVGVTHYEIASDKIPANYDKYTIVQISDLHDAELGENHSHVVDRVKMITPQAIFITGDFIDSNRYDLEKSLILIEELQFVAPIYYVTGNHEIATQDMDRIKGALEDLGVRVLSNEADVITLFPDSSIAIGGIEDPLASELEDDEDVKISIEQAFENIPDEMFKVLLSHRPEQFDVYAEAGIDVTFSGHAHGGQFRIPGIGGLVSPGQGWFPKYSSGVHEKNGSDLVVSRGLGNSIIPVRLFNQPEIVVVTLRTIE
ncbi:metallophosphoesterase [Sporosarcina sp. resist]|uniref:metallophosphoesterase n=1 Tax=Sporosarcina sp. resist TaxID=2762563 RepID=UPI002105BB76|nr:metallophosphoesterase [Sporosarcina sp. resist]